VLAESGLSALSPDERNQYARFIGDEDREVYLLAHTMLRAALSHYLGRPPADWQFEPGKNGKPRIAAPMREPVEFSLSHTRGLAVCLFAAAGPAGVDVERASRGEEMQEVVMRRFADAERRMLESLPQSLRLERSVWLWTAKEALLKAQGRGLSVPLDRVGLRWDADGLLRLEAQAREPGEAWHFVRFRIDREFLGTAVLAREPILLRFFSVRDAALQPQAVEVERSPDGYLVVKL
jgi:4'-phosphopantetheinyl transferase